MLFPLVDNIHSNQNAIQAPELGFHLYKIIARPLKHLTSLRISFLT